MVQRPEVILEVTGPVRIFSAEDYRRLQAALADTYCSGLLTPPILSLHTGVICLTPEFAGNGLIVTTARYGRPRPSARTVVAALTHHRFSHPIAVYTPEARIGPEEQTIFYQP